MVGNDWDQILSDEYEKDYFKELMLFVDNAYSNEICYPDKNDIFKALRLSSYKNTKVVILGQDPYHGEGEANGLCFSVNTGIKCPPSLLNIFKELNFDLGIKRTNTDLSDWASQGILLLNSIMSVKKDNPLSHKDRGWEIFTDAIIKKLSQKGDVIFVLWGNYARSKKKLISSGYVIESAHPSPLSASRGFLGSKPFSKINDRLKYENRKPIEW